MDEYYTMEEVMQILQVDEDELRRMISQRELRAVKVGNQIMFPKAEVDKLRGRREAEPTIILTDSDAEIEIPEEQLLVSDEAERETVAGVEIYETEELPRLVSEEETAVGATPVVSAEGPGLEPSRAAPTAPQVPQVSPTAPTTKRTAPFKPATTPGEETVVDTRAAAEPFAGVQEFEVVTPTRAESGRISRSARLRAMQIKRRKPAIVWFFLLVGALALILIAAPFGITMFRGDENPEYARNLADSLRGLGDWLMSLFCSRQ